MSPKTRLAIRLADEGVPIAAIARTLILPFEDIEAIITDALKEGDIAVMPQPDWPHGKIRYGGEVLQEPRQRFAGLDEAVAAVPMSLDLTPAEATILGCLMLRNFASKAFIYHALYGDDLNGGPDPKILDVYICRIRKKVEGISTIWGRGFSLSEESRAKIVATRAAELH
jgi:hypothetical protein